DGCVMDRAVEVVVSRQDALRGDAVPGLSPDVPQPHRPSPRAAGRLSAPEQRAGAFDIRPVGGRENGSLEWTVSADPRTTRSATKSRNTKKTSGFSCSRVFVADP